MQFKTQIKIFKGTSKQNEYDANKWLEENEGIQITHIVQSSVIQPVGKERISSEEVLTFVYKSKKHS
ncbi:MAG: hypothetical protein NTY93_02765 [Candidatus Kaiserbacteria bacterium]|nr:hypothetical protein [Candidatus Kaiserbacteria bacterium]